jgi:hypothetical protein
MRGAFGHQRFEVITSHAASEEGKSQNGEINIRVGSRSL